MTNLQQTCYKFVSTSQYKVVFVCNKLVANCQNNSVVTTRSTYDLDFTFDVFCKLGFSTYINIAFVDQHSTDFHAFLSST